MTKKLALQIGPRDEALLAALDHAPFTTAQLVTLSHTFPAPFPDEHTLRRRLRQLAAAGFVQGFPYAVASLGRSPSYFKLARGGYRLLHGTDAALPGRRYFEPLAPAHHHHTQSLAAFLVRLFTAAHEVGMEVRRFARENSVTIETKTTRLRPDCAFQLVGLGQPPLNFVVELDNGSERVRSLMDVESIERKIRGYDEHQASTAAYDPNRYVVVFVTTRSRLRLRGMLDAARNLMRKSAAAAIRGRRTGGLYCSDNPLLSACCLDALGRRISLVPMQRRDSLLEHSPATSWQVGPAFA
jgi:hypothetical protein